MNFGSWKHPSKKQLKSERKSSVIKPDISKRDFSHKVQISSKRSKTLSKLRNKNHNWRFFFEYFNYFWELSRVLGSKVTSFAVHLAKYVICIASTTGFKFQFSFLTEFIYYTYKFYNGPLLNMIVQHSNLWFNVVVRGILVSNIIILSLDCY